MDTEDSQPPFLKPQLLAAFSSAVVVGIGESFLGPSLDDLESKYKVHTRQISLLFPVCIGAKILGCFVYKHIQKYQGNYLLLSVSSVTAGLLIAILAVLSSFWIALIVIAVFGFLIGILHVGNVAASQFAKDSVLPFYLISFGCTVGNTTGPLLLYSFVRNDNLESVGDSKSYNNGCLFNPNTTFNGTRTNSQIGNGFLIITAVYTAVGIGTGILYLILRNKKLTIKVSNQSENSHWQKGLITFAFITISLFFGFVGGTTNVPFANLLPTFGIHSTLHVDPQIMALMTSSLSAVTLFGRLCGIVFSYAIPQVCLFFFSLVGVLGTSVCLVFIGEKSLTYLWIGTSVFALFYAPVYGSLLTWSEQIVPLSSRYIVIMTYLNNAGLSVISLIIGQLMTIYNPNVLHFSMVFVGCIQLLSFLIMFVISKYIPHYVKDYNDIDSQN